MDKPCTSIGNSSSLITAVVIGIDEYKDSKVAGLYGAVADAKEVQEFLLRELGVAKDRIVMLLNNEATKDAIIQAIKNLAITNDQIAPDHPILVYFAGHGSQAQKPIPEWTVHNESGKIQMLLPYDFAYSGSESQQGQGIWDIMLANYLEDVANARSDNITVILDCCHSASGTRSGSNNNEELAFRGVDLPSKYTIPPSLFRSEISTGRCRGSDVALGYEKAGLKSHVLLASCKEGQTAREVSSRGVFTTQFLALIEKEGINHLTYQDVIMRLPNMEEQNPQCEGMNRNRLLFQVASPSGNPNPFSLIKADQKDRVCVCIKDEDLLRGLAKEFQDNNTQVNYPYLHLVNNEDKERPVLTISSNASRVQFHIKNETCLRNNLTHMPFENIRVSETKFLFSIIRSAARFYRYLNHSNLDKPTMDVIKKKPIRLECFKLIESSRPNMKDLRRPLIPDPAGRNLNIENKITIDAEDKDAKYGFKITNPFSRPLYAALFFFDVSDLSIKSYYTPGAAANGQVDVSLPKNRSLTIGYGDSGAVSRTFYLRENQNVDVGFLKLYVSTQYVDFSSIAQGSPFSGHRGTNEAPTQDDQLWSTFTFPVIQKTALDYASECYKDERGFLKIVKRLLCGLM